MNPNEWIIGRDTGTSSKTIWAVMVGAVKRDSNQIHNWEFDVPHDASDFGRCWRLLVLFPEWKARLSEVSEIFIQWLPLVRQWNELEKLYCMYLAVEDYSHYKKTTKEYKEFSVMWYEFYDAIQELIHEGRLLDKGICRGRGSYHWDDKLDWGKEQLKNCQTCNKKCKFEVMVV